MTAQRGQPRGRRGDDLSIDAHGLVGASGAFGTSGTSGAAGNTVAARGAGATEAEEMAEQGDVNGFIEEWVEQSSNLPLEMKRMMDEVNEKKERIEALNKIVIQRDGSIQRWIRVHGSNVPNPKEAENRKIVLDAFQKISELQADIVKQSEDALALYDRRILTFDKGVRKLVEKGELQEDPDLPSLLKPQAPTNQPADRSADLMNSAFLPTSSNVTPANPYKGLNRNNTGLNNGHRGTSQHNAVGQQSHQATGPAISAIPAAVTAQKARESSAGAPPKRSRQPGSLAIPPVPGNLARQSSLGPGTPKGSNLGSSSRAGSAGPRPLKTGSAMTKKVGPPTKGSSTSRKSHLNKSSLNRVKRTKTGGSPSSNNDSDHSDGESMSPDDDDPSTPPGDRNGDTVMIDADEEDGDDKKYCTCQGTSFGDMVACDNDKCPYEWFHWDCVGITKAPEDSWYCNTPACNATRKR